MQLKLTERTADTIEAGYNCPCGCTPAVTYARGTDPVQEGCCCGNHFAVGPDASSTIQLKDGFHAQTESFKAPWGDELEAAWAIGPSVHE